MARFLPKAITEDQWKPLEPHRGYAIRSNSEDTVYLRLGHGKSFYLEIVPTQFEGRVVNSIQYDNGDAQILYKLQNHARITIGRTGEANVKIVHAYISRMHLELGLEGNIVSVRDLGSVNGTYYFVQNVVLDVDRYIENHPLDNLHEGTLDAIHEAFGPTLDDFLRNYQQQRGTSK